MGKNIFVEKDTKVEVFLVKLYEENIIDTETYIVAQKMARGIYMALSSHYTEEQICKMDIRDF